MRGEKEKTFGNEYSFEGTARCAPTIKKINQKKLLTIAITGRGPFVAGSPPAQCQHEAKKKGRVTPPYYIAQLSLLQRWACKVH